MSSRVVALLGVGLAALVACGGDTAGTDAAAADVVHADVAGPDVEADEAGPAEVPPADVAQDLAATPETLDDTAVDETGTGHPDATAGDPSPEIEAAAVDPDACNGSVTLCDRRYDQVVYATTHNSMSNDDEGWLLPNQHRGLTRQLEDGIRGLMPDFHYWDGDGSVPGVVYVCHQICEMGHETLVDWLGKIKAFGDARPREVITLIVENYVSAADIAAAFDAAGLTGRLYALPDGAPWPTLGEMIAAGRTLVVLTDSAGGDPAWLMDEFSHVWETPWSYKSAADFTCNQDRGSRSNPLFVLDHFLEDPFPGPQLAETVNHDPLLLDRMKQCQAESGSLPNFPTVDFYDIGDLFAAVDAMNGL